MTQSRVIKELQQLCQEENLEMLTERSQSHCMPVRRGHLTTQNWFIDAIIRKFDGFPGRNFIIGNAAQSEVPIIYCSSTFCSLSGYDKHEIVQKGCSCDFMYGPATDSSVVENITNALSGNVETNVTTYFYRKNKDKFLSSVIILPIKNEQGDVLMYLVNHEEIKEYTNGTLPITEHKESKTSNPWRVAAAITGLKRSLHEKSRKTSVNNNNAGEVQIPLVSVTMDDSPQVNLLQVQHSNELDARRLSHSSCDLRYANDSAEMLNTNSNVVRSSSESNLHHAAKNGAARIRPEDFTRRATALHQSPAVTSHRVAQVMSLGSDVLPEYKVESPKIHPWTILHYSPFKAIWDWVVLFLVMYTAIITPYMAAFVLSRDAEHEVNHLLGDEESISIAEDPLVIIDYIVDVMFIVDIFINFRTTFVDSNDEVVSDPCRVAVNYMKGWFIVDLLAAVPFELLIMIENTDQTTTLIGLLKTARLLRLVRVARKLDRYSEYGTALLLLLMFGFALIAHWLACIWYAIGTFEDPRENDLNWLAKLGVDTNTPYNASVKNSGPDLQTKYLTALYFTLSSLTSVGFGNVSANTNGEKVFTILIMFLGALMHAIIFGNVTAIIQRLYSGMAHYHSTMRKVREFIRFYQIPSPLRQRLEDYSQYDYSYTNGIDMDEVLRNFPEGLQADICLHLNRNLLASNPAFSGSTPGCLRSLSLKLKTTHCPPGDYITHYGDEILNLTWIGRGTVEIIQNETIIAILGKCDSFGENFGLVANRMTGKARASVRALTYCDLHSIARDDLLNIMRTYPEFHTSFNHDMHVTFDLRDLELEEKDLNSSLCNLTNQRENVRETLRNRANSCPSKTKFNDDIHYEKFGEAEDARGKPLPTRGTLSPVFTADESSTSRSTLNVHQNEAKKASCCNNDSALLRRDIEDVREHLGRLEKNLTDDIKSILTILKGRSVNLTVSEDTFS